MKKIFLTVILASSMTLMPAVSAVVNLGSRAVVGIVMSLIVKRGAFWLCSDDACKFDRYLRNKALSANTFVEKNEWQNIYKGWRNLSYEKRVIFGGILFNRKENDPKKFKRTFDGLIDRQVNC